MKEQVALFQDYLEEQELSPATIRIYMRYIRKFIRYLDEIGRASCRERV